MVQNAEHIQTRDTLVECGRLMCNMTEADFLQTRLIPAPLVRSACYKLMQEQGLNAREVGEVFGKDRCTIIGALRKFGEFQSIGDKLAMQIYNELKRALQ